MGYVSIGYEGMIWRERDGFDEGSQGYLKRLETIKSFSQFQSGAASGGGDDD